MVPASMTALMPSSAASAATKLSFARAPSAHRFIASVPLAGGLRLPSGPASVIGESGMVRLASRRVLNFIGSTSGPVTTSRP